MAGTLLLRKGIIHEHRRNRHERNEKEKIGFTEKTGGLF